MSYPGYSLGRGVSPLCRDAVRVFYSPPTDWTHPNRLVVGWLGGNCGSEGNNVMAMKNWIRIR